MLLTTSKLWYTLGNKSNFTRKFSELEGVFMHKIDCFGDICPIPILKMQKELSHLPSGDSFMMVVDHSCVIESIKEHLSKSKYQYSVDEVMNGVWEITISHSNDDIA